MVHLKSIWEADLESIQNRFGVHVGYVLGSIWCPFGVCVGSSHGPFSHLTATLASDPLGARFLDPRDRSWRLSWTPCWPHVGSMLEAVGRLEGSLGVSGPI